MIKLECRSGNNSSKRVYTASKIEFVQSMDTHGNPTIQCWANGGGLHSRNITKELPFCPVILGTCTHMENILSQQEKENLNK